MGELELLNYYSLSPEPLITLSFKFFQPIIYYLHVQICGMLLFIPYKAYTSPATPTFVLTYLSLSLVV